MNRLSFPIGLVTSISPSLETMNAVSVSKAKVVVELLDVLTSLRLRLLRKKLFLCSIEASLLILV